MPIPTSTKKQFTKWLLQFYEYVGSIYSMVFKLTVVVSVTTVSLDTISQPLLASIILHNL